jgi:bifunctional non-homologous end joining protein LigD
MEQLRVTHASRVIDPSTGFTKLDLVRYYVRVARWMMPHLGGRPAYIRHAPLGIHQPMKFLQHPSYRNLKGTDPRLWPGHDPAIAFDTAEELVAAAQVGMVEVHTWNSTSTAITKPDRLVFDLDPGEGIAWQAMREGAQLLRSLLGELGLESWLKTTGGKGLHLFVPIRPDKGYEDAKAFAHAVVQHIAATLPGRFVAILGPRNRKGRIFVDYLRNGWVQSTAETYSARARPGMGVSMPVSWDELPKIRGGDEWNIVSAPRRLDALGRDPWKDYFTSRQSLAKAMKALSVS